MCRWVCVLLFVIEKRILFSRLPVSGQARAKRLEGVGGYIFLSTTSVSVVVQQVDESRGG